MAEPDDAPVELDRADEAEVEAAEDDIDDDEDAPSDDDFVPKPTKRVSGTPKSSYGLLTYPVLVKVEHSVDVLQEHIAHDPLRRTKCLMANDVTIASGATRLPT